MKKLSVIIGRELLILIICILCAFAFIHLYRMSGAHFIQQANATEADIAHPWCAQHGGQSEVVLADDTRADCVMPGYAVEVDFGHKWAESIGQALHYAQMTGKRPGVMLILTKPTDAHFAGIVASVSAHYHLGIRIWTVREY